uniref:Uncharacterized protein n=1 Tax=Arundo donax TaxID=35708 RepID=A0A0A9A883_ARUDO
MHVSQDLMCNSLFSSSVVSQIFKYNIFVMPLKK